MKTVEDFNPNVTGIETTPVNADKGCQIWDDKSDTISDLSDELKNATLFRSNSTAKGPSITINSNKNATVYIALFNDKTGEVSDALKMEGWELRTELFLKLGGNEKNVVNQKKFDKVFSKTINDKDPVTLKRPNVISEDVSFAILIKEGKFCLMIFFVDRRNINILY